MEPLGTRKQRRDGDEEKTHLCIRLAPGQQRYLQTLKDPYSFDFLTMRDDYDEKELEDALVNQITQFLLELGTGFSYVGRQVHLQVGEREFYIDLLFYHIKLHCYVVVELKTKRFEPEYVGKLNFYVTAVNKQLTGDGDNPAIGLLICKDKDNVSCSFHVIICYRFFFPLFLPL